MQNFPSLYFYSKNEKTPQTNPFRAVPSVQLWLFSTSYFYD